MKLQRAIGVVGESDEAKLKEEYMKIGGLLGDSSNKRTSMSYEQYKKEEESVGERGDISDSLTKEGKKFLRKTGKMPTTSAIATKSKKVIKKAK